MEGEKQGPFNSMKRGQAFAFGAISGVLVLCTIGFFILLAVVLSGDGLKSSSNPEISAGVEGPEKFSECLDSGKYAAAVQADMQLGASLGVNGTPATFINGYLISGALPFSVVKDIVDDLLSGEEPFIDDYEQIGLESGELEKTEMPEFKDAVWQGNEDAAVTLVEFSDFECPYCSRFAATVEQLMSSYSDKVRFTYRHFPLSFHAQAQKAAEAFECAKEQGKAFEMHDELFGLSEAGTLNLANFKKVAGDLGLK